MSTFSAKKEVEKASIQHSGTEDQMKGAHEFTRSDMVKFVKNELQCTLGSVPMSITTPILVDQYREDTGDDLREIAKALGYPTPDAMLRSEEFNEVVSCDFTETALGSNTTGDEKILCYRVVPNNRTKHLIDAIVQCKEEREIQHQYRELSTKALMDNASVNTKILEGKERILAAMDELSDKGATNDGFIELLDLQRKYQEIHGVMLDREEFRKYFPKTHMKKVIDNYMSDDIELGTRVEATGSMFLRLKRPIEEIMADHEKIRQHRHKNSKFTGQKPMANGNIEASNGGSSGIVPLQPKENPPVVPTVQKNAKLHTNDALLARKFGQKDDDFEDEPRPSRRPPNFSFKHGNTRSGPVEPPEGEIIPGLSFANGNSSASGGFGGAQRAPPKSNGGGRPRGNVEELEAIFNASKRNNFSRKPDKPNYLEKKNGWSSNFLPKKEFNNNGNNNTYTTRDNGNYTDKESSSDSEDELLDAGNKQLRTEQKRNFSLKPLGNTLKTEELLAKAGILSGNSTAMPPSDSAPVNFESNNTTNDGWRSFSERYAGQENSFLSQSKETSKAPHPKVHAEKFLRQAMENKNEGRARFLATKLATEESNVKSNIVKPYARVPQGPIVSLSKPGAQSEPDKYFDKFEQDEEQAVPNGNEADLCGGFGTMLGNRSKSRSPSRVTRRVPEISGTEPVNYFSDQPTIKSEKPNEKPARFSRSFNSGNFSVGGVSDVNSSEQNVKPRSTSRPSFFSKFKNQLTDNGMGSADREVADLLGNGVAESQMDDNAQSNIHSLVAAINLFVMHHQPTVTVECLNGVLDDFYGIPVRAGEFFKEKTWLEFIKKHCRNINTMETGKGVILSWSSRDDSGMKDALRDFANYSKEGIGY